jgi:hypothetical protein
VILGFVGFVRTFPENRREVIGRRRPFRAQFVKFLSGISSSQKTTIFAKPCYLVVR